MARTAIEMTQITSATELHNRIPVSRLTPSPIGCEVVVLMSEADRLPWRCAPLWHFKRMARSKMKQSIGSGRSSSDRNQQSAMAARTGPSNDDQPGAWRQDGLLNDLERWTLHFLTELLASGFINTLQTFKDLRGPLNLLGKTKNAPVLPSRRSLWIRGLLRQNAVTAGRSNKPAQLSISLWKNSV